MTQPLFQSLAAHIVKPEWADRVVSRAYDAMSHAERDEIAKSNPWSYLNVTRSPADSAATDPEIEALLSSCGDALDRLFQDEVYEAPPGEGLLIYRLALPHHTQTGIVGLMPTEATHDGRIRKHENILPARAELLARHLEAVGAASSPVALAHRPTPAITEMVAEITATEPALSTSAGGVEQTLWRTTDAQTAALQAALQSLTLYITDGHHRFGAAAVAASKEPGSPHSRVLSVSFPSDEQRILAFHRRVRHTNGHSPAELIAALGAVGDITQLADAPDGHPRPNGTGEATVYLDNTWYRFSFHSDPEIDPAIDAEVLQVKVLDPILGIIDPNGDDDVEYLADPVGVAELVTRCDADNGVAFVLHPTTIEQIIAVADSQGLMPPKSSYFEPKPRSGLFVHRIE